VNYETRGTSIADFIEDFCEKNLVKLCLPFESVDFQEPLNDPVCASKAICKVFRRAEPADMKIT
jgi:hypothetical protein